MLHLSQIHVGLGITEDQEVLDHSSGVQTPHYIGYRIYDFRVILLNA